MAIPTKDTLLVAWGQNFDEKVTLNPSTYALTAAQATSFHAAYQSFLTAFNAVASAREAGSRSKLLTATKDAAKASLLRIGRELYGYVQDSTSVSAANKLDVGVNPRDRLPSPVPPPATAPDVDVVSVAGNVAVIRLHAAGQPARRGRPPGVDGAAVFSYVGAAAPTAETDWRYEGITGQTTVRIAFPPATPPGAKVWFTARWFNARKQNGPAATAVGTNIPGGGAMAA